MRIGILADPLKSNPVVGLPVYAHNIILGIQKTHHELSLVYSDLPKNDLYPGTIKLKYRIGRLPLISRFIRDKLVNRVLHNLDVFHDPYNTFMPLGKTRCKKVVTVHDVGVLEHPEYFKQWHFDNFKFILPKILRDVDGVITVSRFQKEKILKWLKIKPENVYVVPNGVDISVFRSNKESRPITERFILFVGWIQPRKGVIPLLNAFDKIKHQIPHRLYLLGATWWGTEPIYAEIEKLKLHDRIKIVGPVKHEELPRYYAHAEAMVLPTFNDSFALPVLEAMASGCPVVISNIPALKEIYDGAALMVDPSDISSLAEAILNILDNDALRNDLIEKGLALSREMTWERSVVETLHVYEDVLKANRPNT